MSTAAIFDLDRTLVPGSSAPVLQRHLVELAVTAERDIPGLGIYYRSYELFGENPLVMQLAQLLVRSAKGWSVELVAKAAQAAADELEAQVPSFARLLIDEHLDAGRRVVLATTSPEPFVRPIAERLGMTDVVATRWADDGEVFSGQTDGAFLWGRAKRDAVIAWAEEEGVDLRNSHAYTDSGYDVPMLRAVGHPVAVNPDAQLAIIAGLRGWPIRYLDVPPGVMKIAGRELQDWFRPFNRAELMPNVRFDIAGVENIPSGGPVIVTFNHRSYFDSAAVNVTLAKAGRPTRFLGKKEVFDAPLIGWLAHMAGGIRVDRGTGSDEPLASAIRALEAGELIAMAPQGTIPRGPAFFEPELKGRWGAARLAHATRSPVIPMGIWGTEKVWPRSRRLPSLDLTDPPVVRVRVGTPVELGYGDLDADTKRMMTAISALLPAAARTRRDPTEEELARTYPPGYSGDPSKEADRRPGTDT